MPGASGPTATPPVPGWGEPAPGGGRGVWPSGGAATGARVTAVQDTGGTFTVPQAGQRADNGSRFAPHWRQTVLIRAESRAPGRYHGPWRRDVTTGALNGDPLFDEGRTPHRPPRTELRADPRSHWKPRSVPRVQLPCGRVARSIEPNPGSAEGQRRRNRAGSDGASASGHDAMRRTRRLAI